MNALVAYGADSDFTDSEEDTENDTKQDVGSEIKVAKAENEDGDLISDDDDVPCSSSQTNLLFNNDDDEDEDSSKEAESRKSSDKDDKPNGEKLPNPLANQSGPEQSVFTSDYEKNEQKKLSILEQHVKVREDTSKAQTINGVKVCWLYRRGKCKKGHRCAFAHDNDILHQDEASKDKVTGTAGITLGQGYFAPDWSGSDIPDDDSYMDNFKRKKRFGTTDTLVPPKKAHTELERQREQQRPWTVNKSRYH